MKNSVRIEREKIKLTQAEFAKEIEVSRQTIHAVETGKFNPSVLLALRIAYFLKVNVEDVFKLEDSDRGGFGK